MILAIDTATRTASIALYDSSGVLAEESWRSRNNHSVEVMPAIMRLVERQGCSMSDLAGIAVSLGPGSFTGLRIGLSAAKGLCLALDDAHHRGARLAGDRLRRGRSWLPHSGRRRGRSWPHLCRAIRATKTVFPYCRARSNSTLCRMDP